MISAIVYLVQRPSLLFEKMGHSQPLFYLFWVVSIQTLQFLQYNVKNVHPVSGAGILTHNLLNVRQPPITIGWKST